MWNFLNKKVINGAGVLLAGMMAVSAVPMQVEASGALGISTQVGISGELAQAESTEAVESAVNHAVLNAFHLDGSERIPGSETAFSGGSSETSGYNVTKYGKN